MFKIFLLFAEFEKEYSFILSTSKIKYNVYFTSSGKINYSKQLQDIYDLMKRPWDLFKDLKNEQENYHLISQDEPVGNQQYMVHMNKLKDSENNINNVIIHIKNSILDFLERLHAILSELQEDLKTDCKLISNPQETLVFEARIEGQKKLSGVKIFEAINSITAYVEAFIFRLSRNGDLYGLNTENVHQEAIVDKIIYDEQAYLEDINSKEDIIPKKGASQTKDSNLEEDSTPKKDTNQTENSKLPKGTIDPMSDDSIFDEIDDFL
jgi:hypothetical protein